MKLAVNFSAPLARLLNAGAVTIDLIKCPDWEGMLSEAAPHGEITIHFDLESGLGNTFNADFKRIKALMDRTFTPHVNTHLVTPQQFDHSDQTEIDLIYTRWREEIELMIVHLGAQAVALEHHPLTMITPNLKPAADASIFSQVIADTGCMFLLDLAHAKITASTLGVPVKDYILALPLNRLVEMHITGIKTIGGVLTDHFELEPDDWETLKWALEEIKSGHWRTPDIIAFEYGGFGQTFAWRNSEDVLKDQIPLLYEMVHG